MLPPTLISGGTENQELSRLVIFFKTPLCQNQA